MLKRAAAAPHLQRFFAAQGVAETPALRRATQRAAELWEKTLLAGEGVDLALVLGRGEVSPSRAPVVLRDLGVHLVCPHHLTVAFGQATVAYVPAGRLVGFGALSRLVEAATARLVLQEDAGADIVATLRRSLGAEVAAVQIIATHPCHRLTRPRDHQSVIETLASAGPPNERRRLEALVARAPAATRRRKRQRSS